LHIAACNNHFNCVKILLQNGADILAKEENGWSPLAFAADDGALDCIKLLVEAGTDVNIR